MKSTLDSRTIATSIIIRLNELDKKIRPMKLQKLLYYTIGFYYKEYGKLITEDQFAKWDYDFIVPSVYEAFKKHKGDLIDKPFVNDKGRIEFIKYDDNKFYSVVNKVILKYERFTGDELRNKIKWHDTWKDTNFYSFLDKEVFKKDVS